MKRLVLIDANALIHRSFHALPPLTTKKGELVNAVYGFCSVLLKVINEMKPDYIAAAFDLAEPTFRHIEYEEYKAKRPKAPEKLYEQIPRAKEVLQVMGIPILEKQGFEADDVIGTVAKKMGKKDLETLVITGDLDILQLVDEKLKIYTLKRGLTDTIIYGQKEVQERYELKPEQMIDYKALRGDPSDNIPGVKGIGEKTASTLLKKFGTLENLYRYLDKLNGKTATAKTQKPQKRKNFATLCRAGGEFSDFAIARKILTPRLIEILKQGKKMAFFSKRLVTIRKNVPIKFSLEDFNWQKKFDINKIKELFSQLEFQTLLKRLPLLHQGSGGQAGEKIEPENKPQQQNLL